jgi:hypothetical protein
MTNDQARMTKEIPMTQCQNPSLGLRPIGFFELRHSFVIRISSFVIYLLRFAGKTGEAKIST